MTTTIGYIETLQVTLKICEEGMGADCHPLSIDTAGGKYYESDCANTEQSFQKNYPQKKTF